MCCCSSHCGSKVSFTGFVRFVLIAVGITAIVGSTVSFLKIMHRSAAPADGAEKPPVTQPEDIDHAPGKWVPAEQSH